MRTDSRNGAALIVDKCSSRAVKVFSCYSYLLISPVASPFPSLLSATPQGSGGRETGSPIVGKREGGRGRWRRKILTQRRFSLPGKSDENRTSSSPSSSSPPSE